MTNPVRFTGYRGPICKEIAKKCSSAEVQECPKDCRRESAMWGEVWKACPKRAVAKQPDHIAVINSGVV